MADDEEEILEEEESGRGRRRNPTLDPSIAITDQEYASRDWYRFSHEANTFSGKIDSRIVDNQVENDDRSGVRFYVPLNVLQFKEERKEFNGINLNLSDEQKEKLGEGDNRYSPYPGLGIVRNLAGKIVRLGRSQQPRLNTELNQRIVDQVWYEINKERGEKIAQTLEEKRTQALEEAEQQAQQNPRGPQSLNDSQRERIRKNVKLTNDEEEAIYEEAVNKFLEKLGNTLEVTRKWFLTPMNIEALPQSPRRPFFMIYKGLLDALHQAELLLRENNPDDLVEYRYIGCVVPNPSNPVDLVSMDELLVSFIRSDDGVSEPPFPLVRDEGKYKIPRRYEDERATTLRAHLLGAQMMETAEDVLFWENYAKTDTNYYGGHDLFNQLPVGWEVSDEGAFAFLADQEKRFRQTAGAEGLAKHTCENMARKLRKYYEDWLDEHFDRWLPSETYDYRNRFFDKLRYHGPDWESKADRFWDVMGMQIFIIKFPRVIDALTHELDWTEFQVYIAPVENRRDIVRLYNHWKMSKSMGNTKTANDLSDADIKNARRNDWGSMWTGLKKSGRDWRLSTLKEAAALNPARALDLLGPIWIKRELWQPMDHDGSLISKFADTWENWLEGIGFIRGLSSMAGVGIFPNIENLTEKYLAKVRNYRSEWFWMWNYEYTHRDPVDAWENQNGVIVYALVDEVNMRLDGPFSHVPWLRLNYFNCTRIRDFIHTMWENIPAGPFVEVVEHTIHGWKKKNIEHIRPLLNKELLEGVHINEWIKPHLEEWYRDSDERYWEYVYYWSENMSTLEDGPSAAGGFSINDAVKACKDGFGLGYGPLEMWQHRQEVLMEVGLYTGYFTVIKGVLEWWSVRVEAVKLTDEKSWPSLNELKMKVAGLLESRKLLYVIAEQVLWPQLKIRKLLPSDDPFPWRMDSVQAFDNSFVFGYLNERAGVDRIPTLELAEAETSGRVSRIRTELIERNNGRYTRIAAGRFFEINQ